VLALGGYLFTRSENQRTQQIAERQRNVDREIAQQQAETDRGIAEQRRQDDTLQAYLDQIGQLLLDKERPLRQWKKGDKGQTLARARTLTVLARLDGDRKGSVLQFLYESKLITEYKVDTHPKFDVTVEIVLEFHGADLSESNLSRISLSGSDPNTSEPIVANLSLTNLSGADLSWAALDRAGLIRPDLSMNGFSRCSIWAGRVRTITSLWWTGDDRTLPLLHRLDKVEGLGRVCKLQPQNYDR
jgi:hypothetical protein